MNFDEQLVVHCDELVHFDQYRKDWSHFCYLPEEEAVSCRIEASFCVQDNTEKVMNKNIFSKGFLIFTRGDGRWCIRLRCTVLPKTAESICVIGLLLLEVTVEHWPLCELSLKKC